MQTDQEWLSIVKEWEQSSLTQQEYCEQAKVKYWKFCEKRGQLIRRGLLNRSLPERRALLNRKAFLPIELPKVTQPKLAMANMIEIQLPHGVVLRIPTDVAA